MKSMHALPLNELGLDMLELGHRTRDVADRGRPNVLDQRLLTQRLCVVDREPAAGRFQ